MPLIAKSRRRDSDTLPLVKTLRKSLVEARRISVKTPFRGWVRDFDRAIREGVCTRSELEESIEWYTANLGGQFTPRVESAAAFIHKYHRIRAQMERFGVPAKPEPKKKTAPYLYVGGWLTPQEYEARAESTDPEVEVPQWPDVSAHVVMSHHLDLISDQDLQKWVEGWEEYHGRKFPYDQLLERGIQRGLKDAGRAGLLREVRL